ncbi:MAG: DUF2851 family protein [Lentisphaeria bacterium]|nr:DUF2851 family protein [Lentisphaeria bacterium]
MAEQNRLPAPDRPCEKCTGSNEQCQFSERFLQIIWNEKLLTANLHCSDGTALRIVSGGSWNNAAGPDFSRAVLLFDAQLSRGDVEIHRYSSDWFRHGHQSDPAYDEVILHVVWQNDLPPEKMPGPLKTLEICHHLLPSWQRLLSDVEEAFYPYARQVPPGSCALQWALLDNHNLQRLLQSASLTRFAGKKQRFQRRSAEAGFSEGLYQEFFAGLGYANNRIPFHCLAEKATLKLLAGYPKPEQRQAILFGLAGLLPDPTRETLLPEFRPLLDHSWQYWWESGLQGLNLTWQQNGGRPYNSCQRRLQAGFLWLEKVQYDPGIWLQKIMRQARNTKQLLSELLDFPKGDPLWCNSKDFAHRLQPGAALLGKARARDLVLNVLLPAAAAWAEQEEGEYSPGRKLIEQAWLELPPGQDNHLFREACHRFLVPPSRAREILKKAYHQQGLLDIYQNFCLALDHDCTNCPFISESSS